LTCGLTFNPRRCKQHPTQRRALKPLRRSCAAVQIELDIHPKSARGHCGIGIPARFRAAPEAIRFDRHRPARRATLQSTKGSRHAKTPQSDRIGLQILNHSRSNLRDATTGEAARMNGTSTWSSNQTQAWDAGGEIFRAVLEPHERVPFWSIAHSTQGMAHAPTVDRYKLRQLLLFELRVVRPTSCP